MMGRMEFQEVRGLCVVPEAGVCEGYWYEMVWRILTEAGRTVYGDEFGRGRILLYPFALRRMAADFCERMFRTADGGADFGEMDDGMEMDPVGEFPGIWPDGLTVGGIRGLYEECLRACGEEPEEADVGSMIAVLSEAYLAEVAEPVFESLGEFGVLVGLYHAFRDPVDEAGQVMRFGDAGDYEDYVRGEQRDVFDCCSFDMCERESRVLHWLECHGAVDR